MEQKRLNARQLLDDEILDSEIVLKGYAKKYIPNEGKCIEPIAEMIRTLANWYAEGCLFNFHNNACYEFEDEQHKGGSMFRAAQQLFNIGSINERTLDYFKRLGKIRYMTKQVQHRYEYACTIISNIIVSNKHNDNVCDIIITKNDN